MKLEKILQDISAGILVTDGDFRIIWANAFEEKYYGKPLAELLGGSVVDCHKPENREKIEDFLQQFQRGEMKVFTKTGVGMLITYSSYTDDQGQFAGIVRTRIRQKKK